MPQIMNSDFFNCSFLRDSSQMAIQSVACDWEQSFKREVIIKCSYVIIYDVTQKLWNRDDSSRLIGVRRQNQVLSIESSIVLVYRDSLYYSHKKFHPFVRAYMEAPKVLYDLMMSNVGEEYDESAREVFLPMCYYLGTQQNC